MAPPLMSCTPAPANILFLQLDSINDTRQCLIPSLKDAHGPRTIMDHSGRSARLNRIIIETQRKAEFLK